MKREKYSQCVWRRHAAPNRNCQLRVERRPRNVFMLIRLPITFDRKLFVGKPSAIIIWLNVYSICRQSNGQCIYTVYWQMARHVARDHWILVLGQNWPFSTPVWHDIYRYYNCNQTHCCSLTILIVHWICPFVYECVYESSMSTILYMQCFFYYMIIYVPNSQIQFEMNESMFNVALQHNSPLRPRTFQSNKQFAALNLSIAIFLERKLSIGDNSW